MIALIGPTLLVHCLCIHFSFSTDCNGLNTGPNAAAPPCYKELLPMKKDQVDLDNAVVWIPDAKTPTGIAEVPLTNIAVEAFR